MGNNDNVLLEYLKITGGFIPETYLGPEEQAKRIVRCSILEDTVLEYSNSTSEISMPQK